MNANERELKENISVHYLQYVVQLEEGDRTRSL